VVQLPVTVDRPHLSLCDFLMPCKPAVVP
jgi:hypothetical protein